MATGKGSAAAEAGGVDACRPTPSFALLCSLPPLSESLPLSGLPHQRHMAFDCRKPPPRQREIPKTGLKL